MPKGTPKKFKWTGQCRTCYGPSNRYEYETPVGPRPSRTTRTLDGLYILATGELKRFLGERIEICAACNDRFKYWGHFCGRRDKFARDRILEYVRVESGRGIPATVISQRVDKPVELVREWIKDSRLKTTKS